MEDLNSKITESIINYRHGDTDAFTGIYEGTYTLVYTTCYGMLHNEDDARDMTQEVYIKIYEKLDTLEEPRAYGRWMKMMATNMCLNQIKKMGRMNEHPADDEVDLENFTGEWEVFDSLPNSFIEEEEKRDIINKVLKESLSEVQYQTVFMHYYGDMQLTDIAKQMDCPEGTVKTRLMKAKEKFKTALSKYVDENKLVLGTVPFMTRFFESSMSDLIIPIPPFSIPQSALSTASVHRIEMPKVADAPANAAAKGGFFTTVPGKIVIGGIAFFGVAAVVFGVLVIKNKKDTTVDNTVESTTVSVNVEEFSTDESSDNSVSSDETSDADLPEGEYETKYLMVKRTENGRDTLFEYDEFGRAIKTTYPQSDYYFGYEFDEFGTLSKRSKISISKGEVLDCVEYENTYDEQGKLIRSKGINTKGYTQSDATYKYDGDDLVLKEYYDCSGNVDNLTIDENSTEEYKNGLLIKKTYSDVTNSNGVQSKTDWTKTYEYDANGNIIKSTYHETSSSEGDYAYNITSDEIGYFEVDSNGKCLAWYGVSKFNNGSVYASAVKYERDGNKEAKGYSTKQNSYVMNTESCDNVTLQMIKDYFSSVKEETYLASIETFDTNDNCISAQYFNPDGSVSQEYTKEYDENNNLIHEQNNYNNGSGHKEKLAGRVRLG